MTAFSSFPRIYWIRLLFVSVLIFYFSFTVGYIYVHELVHEVGGVGVSEVCYFGHRTDDPQSMGWTIAYRFGQPDPAGFLIGLLASMGLIAILLCTFAWLERQNTNRG